MNEALPTVEIDAGDYTACGVRLIAPGSPQPGTFQVAVYCDRPWNHLGDHHACIVWDDQPSRTIVAQSSCPLRVNPSGSGDPS